MTGPLAHSLPLRNFLVSRTAQVALTVSMPFFSTTCFTPLDSVTENLVHGCDGEEPTPEPDPSEWMGIGLRAPEEAGQQDDWARLSAVGTKMRLLDPAFYPRTHGHRCPSSLNRSQS